MTPTSTDLPLWRRLEIARLQHLDCRSNAPEVYAAMLEAIASGIAERFPQTSDLTPAALDTWLRQEAARAARLR